MDKNKILIFSDGASKGNPGPGGWGAVVVLPTGKVFELGGAEKKTTNNRMEMMAALSAFQKISSEKGEAIVFTDSNYLINGMTKWIYGWQKNDWQTKDRHDVLNKDLWGALYDATLDRKIKWNYVGGHIGIAGNERCDEIASDLAQDKKVRLFSGNLKEYGLDILNIKSDVTKEIKKESSSGKAYCYLSLVEGNLEKHSTWADCERRVKGKAGAKYRKAVSQNHEQEILREWGKIK